MLQCCVSACISYTVLVTKPTNIGAKLIAVYSSHVGGKMKTRLLPSEVYMLGSLLSG